MTDVGWRQQLHLVLKALLSELVFWLQSKPQLMKRRTTVRSEQVVRVPGWNEVFPLTSSRGYDVAPNSLQTPFTEECGQVRGLGESETKRLNGRLMNAVRDGKFFELVPLTGQTAGAIRDIESAGDIVHRIVAEAEASLKRMADNK